MTLSEFKKLNEGEMFQIVMEYGNAVMDRSIELYEKLMKHPDYNIELSTIDFEEFLKNKQ